MAKLITLDQAVDGYGYALAITREEGEILATILGLSNTSDNVAGKLYDQLQYPDGDYDNTEDRMFETERWAMEAKFSGENKPVYGYTMRKVK